MERVMYVLLGIAACVLGMVLFVLGYRAIRHNPALAGRGKWAKEFWLSAAIVLTFLSTTFYSKAEDREQKTEDSKPANGQTGELAKRINELIKQLGDEDFNTREKAQEELVKMDKAIKPYLEPLLESKDPEVKKRAREIWIKLEFDIEDRVAEIKKTAEWKQLRELFKEMLKYMPAKLEVDQEIEKKIQEQLQPIAERIKGVKEGSTKQTLTQMAQIATTVAGHLSYSMMGGVECYLRKPLSPRKNQDYETQLKLLEEGFKEGRITKEVYDKVKQTIDRHEINKQDPAGWRTKYLADDLDHANTVLIFRLLREVHSPKTPIKWEEVEPKLQEKINGLIKDLGAEDWKTRESAQEALIQIGDPVVPALKETLEKTKDPETKMRVKKILEELE